jgi:metallo-beta-lactamase family protein
LDGAPTVSFLGEPVKVRCKIEFIDVLSAHADRARLYNWIKNNGRTPKKVILNHGDPIQSVPLAEKIKAELSADSMVATPEKSVTID